MLCGDWQLHLAFSTFHKIRLKVIKLTRNVRYPSFNCLPPIAIVSESVLPRHVEEHGDLFRRSKKTVC